MGDIDIPGTDNENQQVVHFNGIPAVKVGTQCARPKKLRFIPPIPIEWDRNAVAAGNNAARIRTLIAYRHRTARAVWFSLPKNLLDSYGIDARVRRRGLHELAAAGLIDVKDQGPGRSALVRVLNWRETA